MKNFYLPAVILLFITLQLKAQAPNSLNYQGVARNSSGTVLTGQNISLRFTIHQTTATGTIVYQETQSTTTNQLGLFTAAIGSGVVVTGTFATIGWGANTEYLQVEMDPTGGNTYLNMGTSQFLSVPYALNSGSSTTGWSQTGNSISATFGTNFIGTTNTAPLEFFTNNTYSGVIDATKANVYFGNAGNGETVGNTNTGSQNVALGQAALGLAGANSNSNVAIGNFALWSNTGSNNISGNNGSVAIGGYTMKNSTGNPNTAVGYQANYSLTSGVNNVSLGYLADWSNTAGSKNVTVGDSAAYGNSASNIVAVGTSALRANSGANNVAVGKNALLNNTSATSNTAVGFEALMSNTTASNNTAVGWLALSSTTSSTSTDNNAFGYEALKSTTSGFSNDAFGFQALLNNTTGNNNEAIGQFALNSNTSGSLNVAIGYGAMYSGGSGTGSQNTSVGVNAGHGIGSVSNNTAVGYNALSTQNTNGVNPGQSNTAIGTFSLFNNTASQNVALGDSALASNSTGTGNTSVGYQSLSTNTAGSDNTAIGYQANVTSNSLSNAIAIGYQAIAPVSNSITLGNSSVASLYLPGYHTATSVLYTSAASGLVAATNSGTNGQVLTMVGGVPAWSSSSGSGTVTSIGTGAGLTGGTITVSGTISLANGTAAGQVFVTGTSPFTPALQTMSQDAIISSAGAVTIQGIQTVPVLSTAPTVSNILAFNGTQWQPTTGGSAGQVLQYSATGVPTWVTPSTWVSSVSATSPLLVTNPSTTPSIVLSGGSGGLLYGTGTGSAFTSAGPIGDILEGQGAGQPPIWTTITALAGGGDNWGTQVVVTDSSNDGGSGEITLTGDGFTSPLKLSRQGATTGQVLTWNGTTWAPGGGSAWQLSGNSGTTPGTNFIGTTDAKDVVFKANNTEIMRIANATGNVGIGTPTPNAGAVLDVSSSTQGMLIPRLPSNPASPVQSMMYFNTTTGCFMFYSGSAWQAIICGCPNTPATPGSITGTANFCPGATGVSYSISAVGNASGYTWTVPTGAIITAGQGSPSIAVTEGTVAGNITVSATNNCGTGAASTLALTPVTTNITGQPANAAVTCTAGNATFTVTATGSPNYHWQVSTNGGSTWAPISNVAPYSNATTATLTITSPPSTMNGYEYECIVTGTCAFTSNAATLSVSSLQSLPITITNSQGTATAAGLQVRISPLSFTSFSNLSNIEFTTGAAGTGTPLYAWIESAAAPTASATELTTAPTTATTTAVVWVNLGTTTIPANSSITIYLTQMASTVMTGTTGFTGEAPQLTGTYGQLDNGALVFPTLYDNFTGTVLNATKWTLAPSCTVTLNNAITNITCPGHWYGIYNNSIAELNTIAEVYWKATSVSTIGPCLLTSGVEYQFGGGSSNNQMGFGTGGTLTTSSGANQNFVAGLVASDWYVFTAVITNSPLPIVQVNYGAISLTGVAATGVNGTGGTQGVGIGISNSSPPTTVPTIQWFRDRVYPPGGVLPTTTPGTFGCY